ncbi:hypothetical protein ACXR2U_19945 [Jatrophihabitans sp. YIM 134969]
MAGAGGGRSATGAAAKATRSKSARSGSTTVKGTATSTGGAKRTGRTTRPARRRDGLLQPLVVTGAVAVILGVLYLAAPLMGQDLSAQIAHADFARDHPLKPVDFRWFGGSLQFGYSLYVPVLAAHVGPQLLGVIAAVVSTLLTTAIFAKARLKRPVIGGVFAAVTQVANLTEGRIAFAVGLAFALAAVLPLVDRDGGQRLWTGVAAFLAAAANPVAGLFVGVVALTVLVHGRIADAARLFVGAALGVAAVSVVFADGGPFVYAGGDAARAAAVTVLVALLVPRWASYLWTGAAIGVVMVAAAYVFTTPVGANASRLALLFAVPVIAAAAEFVWWKTATAIVAAAVIQTPVVFGTIGSAGDPVTRPGYFTALTDQIAATGPLTGRVEIPEVTGHWEAAYVAREYPLARGWLRQVDIELWDHTFYGENGPTPAAYGAFLRQTATQYVAVPDARLTFYGSREAALVRAGLPYLREIWHDDDWTLYAVAGARPVVPAPASKVRLDAADITFTAPAETTITVSARWFRWLTLDSDDGTACIEPTGTGTDTVVRLRTGSGGTYTLTSSLTGDHRRCADAG